MITNLIKFKKVFLLFVVLLLPVYGSCDSREKSAVSISQVSSIEFAKNLLSDGILEIHLMPVILLLIILV